MKKLKGWISTTVLPVALIAVMSSSASAGILVGNISGGQPSAGECSERSVKLDWGILVGNVTGILVGNLTGILVGNLNDIPVEDCTVTVGN
jgi:hypothetical protein